MEAHAKHVSTRAGIMRLYADNVPQDDDSWATAAHDAASEERLAGDLRLILDALDGLGRGDEPPHEPDGWPCPSDMLAGTLSISGRSPRTIRIDFEDVDAANRLLEWLTELNPILDPKPPEPKP
jgi:hypothetical protein